VSSPRVCPHPAQVSRPRCTRHERCSLRCASAACSGPPWPLSGAPCGARAPWKSSPDSDTRCRGRFKQMKPLSASTSARRLPPPWPRAPALPRPASRQHQQAALASSTRASAQPSASLPCGCQHEQRLRTRPCARPSTPWSGSNRGKGCGSGRQSDGEAFACDSVCVCVARACACAQVYVTYTHSRIQSHSCLCVRLSSR
jgi:hypothetical protein